MRSLKICHVTPELSPWAKVGGLADVASALPAALQRLGHEVRVFVPFYTPIQEADPPLPVETVLQQVPLSFGSHTLHFDLLASRPDPDGPWLCFIQCDALFAGPIYHDDMGPWRALFLSRAAIESCQRLEWAPDILHVHDWPTAVVPFLLRTWYSWDKLFSGTRTVLTLHNVAHQGGLSTGSWSDLGLAETSSWLPREDLDHGRVNLLKLGCLHAHALTTVSPTYAREIQHAEQGFGLEGIFQARHRDLTGILNGIDDRTWDPATDPHLPVRYSAETLDDKERNKQSLLEMLGLSYAPDVPAVGMISRLSVQKGLDLVKEVLPGFLATRDLRVIVLETGESRYEDFFASLQLEHPHQVCYYRGFSDELAHRIEAGSDIFLMPSWFEPCGLNQMYSLVYGTLPVVRRTGGLADTVRTFDPATGEGNGVVFDHYDAAGLRWALDYALSVFQDPRARRQAQKNGMAGDYSWTVGASAYDTLYRELVRTGIGSPS